VVNFEVVLANSSIVNANSSSNQDLFYALKGGGNQFGIVTTFTLKVYPIGDVWGGTKLYSAKQAPAILSAIRDFTEYYPDPKAAMIITFEKTLISDTIIIFYFYNGPVVPDGVFNNFTKVPSILSTTKTQRFAALVCYTVVENPMKWEC